MLELSKIRIDGGTQNRVHLNEETVSEYADAITDGARLPAVMVFFDGSDYWLADGFHRYHAHRKIGALSIDADVRNGTVQDAQLFSFSVNAQHGLRRTNADKRKAVAGTLSHPVSCSWSDNQIAKHCGVGHQLVGHVRASLDDSSSEISAPTERTYINKHGQTAQMDVSRIGKSQPEPLPQEIQKPSPKAPEASIPEGMVLISKEELRENTRLLDDTNKDNESMAKIFEASDQLAEAVKEVRRLNALVTVLEERNRGMMNECNEAKRLARSWKNRCEKMEREAKDAGMVDF